MAVSTGMAILGGSLASGLLGSDAAEDAADTQAGAAANAAALQERMFNKQIQLQEPWRKAGEQALNKLLPMATEYTPFGLPQFEQDPGYNFRLSEGMKAIERSAASRGGLLSGATMKGIQRFGQDTASQEYQNAFNRYQAERAARLGPLQSLAGVGQTTAQQLGQAGQTMAGNVGDALTSGAAARASGYMGQANALSGALGSYMNYNQSQNMMNQMRPPVQQQSYTPTTDYSIGADYGFGGARL